MKQTMPPPYSLPVFVTFLPPLGKRERDTYRERESSVDNHLQVPDSTAKGKPASAAVRWSAGILDQHCLSGQAFGNC